MVVIQQDAEKVRQRYGKVKAEAKAEMKKVRSSLNLDLNLSLPRSPAALLGSLFEHPARCSPLSQTCEPVKFWSAHIVFPQPANGERKDESFHSLASCLSPHARAARA